MSMISASSLDTSIAVGHCMALCGTLNPETAQPYAGADNNYLVSSYNAISIGEQALALARISDILCGTKPTTPVELLDQASSIAGDNVYSALGKTAQFEAAVDQIKATDSPIEIAKIAHRLLRPPIDGDQSRDFTVTGDAYTDAPVKILSNKTVVAQALHS
jgi:hypothetical protein